MESKSEIDLAVMIRQSLADMPRLEAQFIQECHLLGKSRKHFASENGLPQHSMPLLQNRAFAQLKECLAEKNTQNMGDVL
jgi:DNA-directed RNA polymerase specialized sigma24 family protein